MTKKFLEKQNFHRSQLVLYETSCPVTRVILNYQIEIGHITGFCTHLRGIIPL